MCIFSEHRPALLYSRTLLVNQLAMLQGSSEAQQPRPSASADEDDFLVPEDHIEVCKHAALQRCCCSVGGYAPTSNLSSLATHTWHAGSDLPAKQLAGSISLSTRGHQSSLISACQAQPARAAGQACAEDWEAERPDQAQATSSQHKGSTPGCPPKAKSCSCQAQSATCAASETWCIRQEQCGCRCQQSCSSCT